MQMLGDKAGRFFLIANPREGGVAVAQVQKNETWRTTLKRHRIYGYISQVWLSPDISFKFYREINTVKPENVIVMT